jgi:hypothetical protein
VVAVFAVYIDAGNCCVVAGVVANLNGGHRQGHDYFQSINYAGVLSVVCQRKGVGRADGHFHPQERHRKYSLYFMQESPSLIAVTSWSSIFAPSKKSKPSNADPTSLQPNTSNSSSNTVRISSVRSTAFQSRISCRNDCPDDVL